MREVSRNNCMRYSFTNRHKNIRKQSSNSYPRKGNNMTDTQLVLLLANIWLVRHAEPRFSLVIALFFLFSAIYMGWLK